MLVLFRSTTSGEKCAVVQFPLVICNNLACKHEYLFWGQGNKVRGFWCNRMLHGTCTCNICWDE
uniref:Uncharacterized protein n=1 Tax=Triticum urartu TaxID=4572 RepID=A0A8R7V8A4_TRIUA